MQLQNSSQLNSQHSLRHTQPCSAAWVQALCVCVSISVFPVWKSARPPQKRDKKQKKALGIRVHCVSQKRKHFVAVIVAFVIYQGPYC